ncbi:hypothetical protein F2Q69_00030355 [Brassica cretica]|uniref:Uncharacterized protein n=1 Tax=Brassica cretica TaxID=69181 RepID=A0A8S9RZ78_BRACR|nr:hypothetical protein F2Q69_00030355 [Brassica cretica]
MHGFVSYQFLRKHGRYVATYPFTYSVATYRPSHVHAQSLRSDRASGRARSLRSERAVYMLGTYVATEPSSVRARLLRSDRAVYVLGSYVTIELRGELGRYVTTELRGELGRYLSSRVRSDRAVYLLGRYVVTELRGELGRYVVTELRGELGRYVVTEFGESSVATLRPSRVRARSLRNDQALVRARSLRSDQLLHWLLRGNLVRVFLRFFVNVFSPQDSS